MAGEAQHDMVVHLRPGAPGASQEGRAGKCGPRHTFRFGKSMALREGDEQCLGPQRLRMAIADLRYADDKGDVKPRLANRPNGVARSALHDLQIDRWILSAKLT
ncbi:hypothetical protein I8G32_04247 [Rhodopseudomonas palustris]|nr:hypothetical protein I8G32_04247 [Rhodopseudomonas palustris]